MKQPFFLVTFFSFFIISCGGEDGSNSSPTNSYSPPIDILGVWVSTCHDNAIVTLEITEEIYEIDVYAYLELGCSGPEIHLPRDLQLNYFFNSGTVTTDTGLTAFEITIWDEADTANVLVYRDGDVLYVSEIQSLGDPDYPLDLDRPFYRQD